MSKQWPQRPLIDFVQHKSGDSKIIKGKQSKVPQPNLVQGYSASGPDIWVPVAKYNQSGVVISAVGARCGKTFLAQGEWTPIANTHALIPSPEINVRWLWYLTNNEDFWIRGGSAQPFVKVKDTLMQPVAIPPLDEQQRIVSILDKLSDEITNSVIQAELNLSNSEDLFESFLAKILDSFAISEPEYILSELCELVVDCEHKTAPTQDTGYPSIRTPNVGMGDLLLDGVRRVSKETYVQWTRRAIPLPNDLILTREAPAGKVGVIPDGEMVCLGQRTVLVRPKSEIFNSTFLAFLLHHPELQKKLLSHSTGATVAHVNMRDIRGLGIGTIPAIEVQEEIVNQILIVKQNSEDVRIMIQKKLDNLVELKQSILQEAFSGKLTGGHPA